MRKVGDTVKIKSKEWIDAQPKDSAGDIDMHGIYFVTDMFKHAGREAKITKVTMYKNVQYYEIDIDEDGYDWSPEMFEDAPNA